MRDRMTAVRASVADIMNGKYTEDEGAKVVSPFGVELRRVMLVGLVVNRYSGQGFSSITIDDGSQTIRVKAWRDDASSLEKISSSSLVLVVGKIRKYDEEIHIAPEIVRELNDPNLMTLHTLERLRGVMTLSGVSTPESSGLEDEEMGAVISVQKESGPVEDSSSGLKLRHILQYIQQNAKPDGVPIEDIVAFFGARGHAKTDIQLKVIDLQGEEKIREVKAGRYVLTEL